MLILPIEGKYVAGVAFLRLRIQALLRVMILVVFVLSMSPLQAWATPEKEQDQTDLSEADVAEAIEGGVILSESEQFDERSKEPDAADYPSEDIFSGFSLFSVGEFDRVESFSGIDRYDTCSQQALAGWSSSEYVILTTGERWADALSASALAGALDSPILLVPKHNVPETVINAIDHLGVKRLIVLGDDNSVSEEVVDQICSTCDVVLEARLAGETRYETQLAIYQWGLERSLWQSGMVAVASGTNAGFADALSFSPVAFATCTPVFLVDETLGFSGVQEAALHEAAKMSSIDEAIILGGANRVSHFTEGYLEALTWDLDNPGGLQRTTRICGTDRWRTSALISEWAVARGFASWEGVALASGEIPFDALGGGAMQGKRGSVMLLASEDSLETAIRCIEEQAGNTPSIRIFGGRATFSMEKRLDIADRLNLPYGDIDGLRIYIDAGHGWNSGNNNIWDGGASGCGYIEADLTRELACLVAENLRTTTDMEVHVNDYGGWFKLRHAEAVQIGCDLLVSIHFNAGGGSGCESYIHSFNAARRSGVLQQKVHEGLVESSGLQDRGMKQDQLVIVSGQLPAVLLEICYIDNSRDMATYASSKTEIARGIALGIAS